jgi:hypothetical protein
MLDGVRHAVYCLFNFDCQFKVISENMIDLRVPWQKVAFGAPVKISP